MKFFKSVSLKDVQTVYGGFEGRLWELVMGEQIHFGGFESSMELATKAGVKEGMRGVDFCCCTGAGMRFLIRFIKVANMTGVDATAEMINLGKKRTQDEGFADKIEFILSDVCKNSLPSEEFDFVWGEDAWCYVEDKSKLISEAARIVKRGGIICFTDWIEGKNKLSNIETERFLKFMKFPSYCNIEDYCLLLKKNGCEIMLAEDTKRFAPCCDLYIDMLTKQLTYDALKIIGYDMGLMQFLGGEMDFMRGLAKTGKIAQGLFVAVKKN